MILPFVLSFTLLALVAGMFLLNKTRKDNLGGFFKFVSWFVIVASFVMMVYAISANCCRIMKHHGMCGDKCCMTGPCGMMGRGHDGCCAGWGDKDKDDCCKGKDKMCCGDHGMNQIGWAGVDTKKACCEGDMDKMTPEQKADEKIKMLNEKGKFTAVQLPKIKEIYVKYYKDCGANYKASGGDMEKCEKLCNKFQDEKVEALKKVLTPEQFKTLTTCHDKK
jgi:hypothetical protein